MRQQRDMGKLNTHDSSVLKAGCAPVMEKTFVIHLLFPSKLLFCSI